ncbi:retrovirus-related pol polyprotein from transposon TNT 1-94 [Tanacetum coccineum]
MMKYFTSSRIEASYSFGICIFSWALLTIRWIQKCIYIGNITEEMYVKQPPGFEDPTHPNKSSMVKILKILCQGIKMSSMGELTFFLGLQVKQTTAGIFLSQDKYVKDILNKFDFRTIKPASTPIEAHKSLGKDEEGEDVDVHLYRSMIGCLMYLTASRPDIMFAVCLCARFQVTPKVSHMHAVKRIFRQSTSEDSISWKKTGHLEMQKQTIVAISSTEAENDHFK